MEKLKAPKRKRAPKVTLQQLEHMLLYMENHTAFATGKLLGAQGKAVHDSLWDILAKQLNEINGPSKPVEGWKKLWCDQRNKVKARAAQAKKQHVATGNSIEEVIELKDFDLRLLSVIGGECAIGLPIAEAGFAKRPEDTIESSVLLGLPQQNNASNASQENLLFLEVEEQDLLQVANIPVEDEVYRKQSPLHDISNNMEPQNPYKRLKKASTEESAHYFQETLNKQNASQQHTPSTYTEESAHNFQEMQNEQNASQQYTPSTYTEESAHNFEKTQNKQNASQQPSAHTHSNIHIARNSKTKQQNTSQQHTTSTHTPKRKKPFVQETTRYFTEAQSKQNDTLLIISNSIERIAFAMEKQNVLLETLVHLQKEKCDK